MTAPAIPLCAAPDAHPTTCPCPPRTGETYYGQPITTTRDISSYQEQHVSNQPEPASRSAAAAQRLAELAQLQPGWYDGEGQPMSRQTLAVARRMIAALRPGLRPIHIYPMVSGGIELEWRDHTGTHSIEINPDDTLFLLSDDPPTAPCDHRCNCGHDQKDHSARYCGRCQDPCNSSGHYPDDCDRTPAPHKGCADPCCDGTLDAYAARCDPEARPDDPSQPLIVRYRNYRGETADRRIVPISVWYGATEWHPEPQWLLRAHDLDKGADRDFALADMQGVPDAASQSRTTPDNPVSSGDVADNPAPLQRIAAAADRVEAGVRAAAEVAVGSVVKAAGVTREEFALTGPTDNPPASELEFVRRVLDVFAKADCFGELLWHLDGGQIKFCALVNDAFDWGSADGEDITPERLPVLEQAYADLKAICATEHTAELYAARIRGERPQGAAYPTIIPARALFDACGPERQTGLGNPRPRPEDDLSPAWLGAYNAEPQPEMLPVEPLTGIAMDSADVVEVDAAGTCPGVELNPNPCTCSCEGCRHHCGAHQPVTARRTLTDLREQYAAAIREVCGEGPWEVIVQRSTDAIMAIHDDDMDATEDEMERRGRVITGLQAQLQRAQAALPERAQAAIRALEQQVAVRDRQLAAVRVLLAAPGNSRQILPGDLRAALDGAEAGQ